MFLPYSVEGQSGRIMMSKQMSVFVLVCVAVAANISAARRVMEIKRDMAFRQQVSQNLDQLMAVTEQIARKRLAVH